MKNTKSKLKKLEAIFEEIDYEVRYEKGNFQAGYCLVNHQKTALINKFATLDGKINCLIEILQEIQPLPQELSEKNQKIVQKLISE